jgi:hypothetical protein
VQRQGAVGVLGEELQVVELLAFGAKREVVIEVRSRISWERDRKACCASPFARYRLARLSSDCATSG